MNGLTTKPTPGARQLWGDTPGSVRLIVDVDRRVPDRPCVEYENRGGGCYVDVLLRGPSVCHGIQFHDGRQMMVGDDWMLLRGIGEKPPQCTLLGTGDAPSIGPAFRVLGDDGEAWESFAGILADPGRWRKVDALQPRTITTAPLFSVPAFGYRLDVHSGGMCQVLRWNGRGYYDVIGRGRVVACGVWHELMLGPVTRRAVPEIVRQFMERWLERAIDAAACPCCGACAPHHVATIGTGLPVGLVCRFCRGAVPWVERCGGRDVCELPPAGPCGDELRPRRWYRWRRSAAFVDAARGACTDATPVCHRAPSRPFVHLWLPDREVHMGPPDPRCASCGACRSHHRGPGCSGARPACHATR